MTALLMCVSFSQVKAQTSPSVNIELLNCPMNDTLVISEGESWTCEVEITSDEPFIIAMGMTDTYYPGRSIVYWDGGDRAIHTDYAVLEFTITGKSITQSLPAVSDWPLPGIDWGGNVAPVSIRAGVRYKGGLVVAQEFPFAVMVLP
jgi:hypothetical protein